MVLVCCPWYECPCDTQKISGDSASEQRRWADPAEPSDVQVACDQCIAYDIQAAQRLLRELDTSVAQDQPNPQLSGTPEGSSSLIGIIENTSSGSRRHPRTSG